VCRATEVSRFSTRETRVPTLITNTAVDLSPRQVVPSSRTQMRGRSIMRWPGWMRFRLSTLMVMMLVASVIIGWPA